MYFSFHFLGKCGHDFDTFWYFNDWMRVQKWIFLYVHQLCGQYLYYVVPCAICQVRTYVTVARVCELCICCKWFFLFCNNTTWLFDLVLLCLVCYTLCPEKMRQKCFCSVISPTKLCRFWWNLVYHLLNKFAAKSCKQLSPLLNNVSTLPSETWNAHQGCRVIELLQTETPEFVPAYLWPQNLSDLNPVDNNMWEILQEKVYKTGITDLDVSTTPMAAAMKTWSSLAHSILSRCFSSFRSVMCVL